MKKQCIPQRGNSSKINRKIVEKGKIDNTTTHIHDTTTYIHYHTYRLLHIYTTRPHIYTTRPHIYTTRPHIYTTTHIHDRLFSSFDSGTSADVNNLETGFVVRLADPTT
jgi:hypothetical protein